MAITLRYDVPAELQGRMAYQAGTGQYQQAQDRLALEQEALAQRERLSLAQLAQQREIAALGAQQQNRQLGAQMYQFDAQRQDRAALAEMDIASRFQQEMLRQQGFADMREADAELQTQRLTADLTKEQMRIKQHYQDREFNQAMAAAKAVEEQRQYMSPEMYDQALGQWEQRYGQTAGEYPFVGPNRPQNAPEVLSSMRASMQGLFGSNYVDGMENWVMNLEEPDRIKVLMDGAKLRADSMRAEEEARIRQSESQYELHRQAIEDEQKLKSAEALSQQKIIEAQRKQLMDAIKAASTPVKGLTGEPPTLPSPEQAAKQVELMMNLWERFGVGEGVGAPQQQPGGVPRVTSVEEYNALPAGTEYIDPNGKTKIKR